RLTPLVGGGAVLPEDLVLDVGARHRRPRERRVARRDGGDGRLGHRGRAGRGGGVQDQGGDRVGRQRQRAGGTGGGADRRVAVAEGEHLGAGRRGVSGVAERHRLGGGRVLVEQEDGQVAVGVAGGVHLHRGVGAGGPDQLVPGGGELRHH